MVGAMNKYASALITGASSGIGAALAIELAHPGVRLHLGGRDMGRLHEVAESCEVRGAHPEIHAVDVRDADGVAAWIAAAGHLDLVVANAGINAGGSRHDLGPDARTREIFAANLDGMLNTVLPAVAAMRDQVPGTDGIRGRIAVVASIAAFVPLPGGAAYSAAKAAADTWTVACTRDARRAGIHMTSACPGYIRTPMTEGNEFPMPGLMDSDRAARLILRAVAAGRRRVTFPWWMGLLARTGGLLPPAVLERLSRLVERG